jgi:hypothetical protein
VFERGGGVLVLSSAQSGEMFRVDGDVVGGCEGSGRTLTP